MPGREQVDDRIRIRGKFFYAGEERLRIQGVTYGPFRPDDAGCAYGTRAQVERDFDAMVENGINAVRTYTVPPRWLLDAALERGLHVMVGLAWEQHIAFLDDAKTVRGILRGLRESVRSCAGHPAVFAYAIGNEIPAPIVRWHGHRKVRSFLRRLFRAAKAEDPQALVTYISYPTTEYLELPFLDFLSFNVFLEEREKLAGYLARLQNIAGELPLVLGEVGLDSLRNGREQQAETLAWQIRAIFEAGCAGGFVFSWTDEWHRGGCDIEDWAFGLVDRERQPKPALEAVCNAYGNPLLANGAALPRISVVVCSYNGESTLRECLEGIAKLEYPDYEVLVVNDGSTDGTAAIAAGFDVRLIDIENGGLSHARNVGMRAATGEIVAYLDDDAWPDPHWLSYLALSFRTSSHVGVGGPNLPPRGDGAVADCVANAPGGPSHVLRSDCEAEHLPGCNMAFRREAILAIDGFDEQFRIAGDDVDLCWRLQERGGTLGFNPCAVVWHHRRSSVRVYLKQQYNYGKAEGMLEAKWPEKYNRLGHMKWAGHLYGKGHTPSILPGARRIDHGVWGSRLFQSMYASEHGPLWSLTMMPEWYLVVFTLAAFSLLGLLWKPLLAVLPLLAISALVPLAQACLGGWRASFGTPPRSLLARLGMRLLTASLHVLQPVARLLGRVRCNLAPWRLRGARSYRLPLPGRLEHWSESWQSLSAWLTALERQLRRHAVLVRRGGNFDRWDLQADCGLLGGARLLSTLEEHGSGRQLLRLRVWPRASRLARLALFALPVLAWGARLQEAWIPFAVLAALAVAVAIGCLRECSSSLGAIRREVGAWRDGGS